MHVIEPGRRWSGIDWKELWRYRELLGFLAWRDIQIRYRQTALGAAWAVLQPLLTMAIFAVLFGRLAGFEQKTGGIPYAVYVYAGLLPWTFFASAVGQSGGSVVSSSSLITRVYFPRLIIPLAAVGAGLADLAVSLLMLLALMIFYGTPLSWQLALAPVFLAGTILAAAGVGTLLSALTVRFRDFRHVVPFLVQVWFFLTPVIYPVSILPPKWRDLLAMNPMYGMTEGFRAAFLAAPLVWTHAAAGLTTALVLFAGGAAYFRQAERRFADVI